jgi:RNA polymerase sigma-70 factor (ECF subfamily)
MAALPGEQREALELAYFEGMTQTEIAERTGAPLGTVKSRVRAAMQSLKQYLQ